MNYKHILIATAIMAAVTYAIRVTPLVLFRKKIENRFIQSFLLYMPYGVLAAMVFPNIFYSTASLISGICGTIVALILAFNKKGLLPVALSATATVFIVEQILKLIGI